MTERLTDKEYEFRVRAVQAAIDNNRLEGLSVDSETMNLFNAWIENKISFDEIKRSIYEICGVRSIY